MNAQTQPNPYAPPQAEVEDIADADQTAVQAVRGIRLGAALLDTLVGVAVGIIGVGVGLGTITSLKMFMNGICPPSASPPPTSAAAMPSTRKMTAATLHPPLPDCTLTGDGRMAADDGAPSGLVTCRVTAPAGAPAAAA